MTEAKISGLAMDVIVALVELDSHSDIESARITLKHILDCAQYASIGTREKYYNLAYDSLRILSEIEDCCAFALSPFEEETLETVVTKLKVFLNDECGIVIED